MVEVKQGGPETKWSQWAILGAVVLVLAVGGYFLVKGTAKAPSESEDETASLEGASVIGEEEHEHDHAFSWSFAPAGGNNITGAYTYAVTLTVDGESRQVGVFQGPCDVISKESEWSLAPNELTGVVCYFNDVGDEMGVFLENGAMVVKKTTITPGEEGAPAVRGAYETVFAI